jgi:16S rRNA (guanine527-N7)-methyltransferase
MARSKPLGQAALIADRAKALTLMDVSHETVARFDRYIDLLIRWQTIKNLVGPSTLATLWTRHIADCAQLVRYGRNAKTWVDIGSGAGFPGLVIAILLGDEPDFHIHLVESNGRKVAFLREVVRPLDLPATVHDSRIEVVRAQLPASIDCVTARALAPLNELLALQAGLTQNPCIGLFLKGQDVDAELTLASKYWIMDVEIHPSVTDPMARIVEMIRFSPRE